MVGPRHFGMRVGGRRPVALAVLITMALVASILVGVSPGIAKADEASNWTLMNGQGVFAERFGSSDTVFLTGVQTGGVIPASDVYVTPNQDWSGRGREPLADVSNPSGTPNTVVGFEVIQFPIVLPHLRVGAFDVVIDADQDGHYSPGEQVVGFDADPGFTVFFDGNTQAIDKERLKEEYAKPWRTTAEAASQIATVVEIVELVDEVNDVVKLANEPATWLVEQGYELLVELGGKAIIASDPELRGLDLKMPTSADIREAAEDLRRAAAGIAADPPDPEFRTVAPYEPPSEVEDESITESPFREMASLVNRVRETAAYSTALLHAIERFDGAAAADEPAYTRLQAAAIEEFAAALTAKLAEANTAAGNLAAALRAAGVPGSLGEDRDQVLANQARLRDSGFTPEEIQGFHAAGLDDDLIAKLRQQILDIPVEELTSDLATQLDAFEPPTEPGRRGLFDLQAQARNILDAPVGQAPVARDDSVAATSGAATTFDVLANDSDPDGDPISVAGTTQPGSGTVSCQPTGACGYTSAEGFTGTDSFTYTLRDAGGLTATGTVRIDVAAANHQPVAVDDRATVATGGTVTIDLVGNDTDADGDQLRVTATTAPSHGTVTCPPGAGTCQYSSTAPYVGADAFTYTVGDGRGGTATGRVEVTVVADNQRPTVELGDDLAADEGANVSLNPTVEDPDGTIAAWSWELGDGRTLESQGGFTVSYPDQGAYTVRLTVTDNLGYTASDTVVVTVTNVAPSASIASTLTRVPPGAGRLLQASAFDPGQDDLAFAWDFGDGESGSGQTVSHAWSTPGTYQVTVTVTDGDGGSATAAQQLTVAAAAADAGPDVEADEGRPVTLGGDGSSPSDPFTTHTWNFGDGSPQGNGRVVDHTYADDGAYTARLTVTDDGSTVTDDAAVSVRNLPPVISGLAAPSEAVVGGPASFKAYVTDPGPNDQPSVRWDFGDGATGEGAAVDHEFTGDGTFEVTARADDGDGGVTTATAKVKVVRERSGVPDSQGREFWLAFDANYVIDDTTALSLFITGKSSTTGTVSVPGIGFEQPFAVTADEITKVELPTTAMLGMGETGLVEPRAIHVAADGDVIVYGLNRTRFTTDAYLGQPVDTAGTRYRVISYGGAMGSEFSVVATRNNTTVTITPSVSTPGRPADEAYTVKLDLGEAYELQAPAGDADLTGTVIGADRPVAVFGGNRCANVPLGVPFCDHIVEQLLPTDRWGQRFVTAPLEGRSADTIRVLADRDDTLVRITSAGGTEEVTLDAGQVHELRTGEPLAIDANHGVLVAQYSNGSTFDSTVSDPFMVVIPPFEQFFTSYVVATPASGFRDNFVNLVVPTGGVDGVSLDGRPVEPGSFQAIPGSDYSASAVRVEPGTHRVASTLPVGVTVYGFDQDDSYGYAGGAGAGAVATVRDLALAPASQTVVVGAQACVTATVGNGAGDPVPGVRVDVTVTGANPAAASRVTGQAATAPFCYPGEEAGEDAIAATTGDTRATATVTWQAESANQPPTATSATVTTPEDTVAAIVLEGSDPEGQHLSYTVVTPPAHGTLSGTAPDLTYMPDPNFSGTDELQFVVSDGTSSSAPATVRITVSPRNDPPTLADPGPQSVDEGDTLTVPLVAVDPDGAGVSLALESGPSGLTLVDGAVRWTPSEQDGPGEYQVTVAAKDGDGGTAKVTFPITVREVNQPPVVSVNPRAVTVQYSDAVAKLTVTATDSDRPRQALTMSVAGLPAGISAGPLSFDEATGEWTASLSGRAAAAAAAGSFPVTVSVDDGHGATTTESATVTVDPETVGIQSNGASVLAVDGKDADLDQLVVPFTVTEDADGAPSSQLPGTAGTRDAVPVSVAAVDPNGRSYRCADESLDAGPGDTAAGWCALQDVVPGVYDIQLQVDNGKFRGTGATVVTVEGAAPAQATGYVVGGGKVAIAGNRSVCFGVVAWTGRDRQPRGELAVRGAGPGRAWKLWSTGLTGLSTRLSSTSKLGEVQARATLIEAGKPTRQVVVKLFVEDRSKRLVATDAAWIGVYDRSGQLLNEFSSAGSPPGDARPLLGDVKVGVQ